MRIAIGQVLHETNTFSSERTDEAAFRRQEWCEEAEIVPEHDGVRDYVGGMIDEARAIGGITLVPTLAVSAEPSGIITAAAWRRIKEALLASLSKIDGIDGICLALHGAGIAENCDDIEGELLHDIRAMFGPSMPIVATLDLHANVTALMVNNADVLLGVNYYPHSDEYDRGREAIAMLHHMFLGKIKPCMHLERLPMIMPTCTTLFGPAAQVNEVCWEWESRPHMLDCTFFHGFPYSDRANTAVTVVAIANNNPALAQEAATSAAQAIWDKRAAFDIRYLSPAEGMRAALAAAEHPVIINETSDNPGAGAPGDGTYLLRVMLAANEPGTCFCHICDPEVVEQAFQAGVNGWIDTELGGKTDQLHGTPLQIRAQVAALTDGVFVQTSPMWSGKRVDLGRSARLLIGNVDVIVTTIKSQLLDDELLKLHQIDYRSCRVVGIKSSQHFRGFFQDRVPEIITVDSPGISTFDFSIFPYEHIKRPIYPLDLIASHEVIIVD
ncbi:M81 family metallopeptidase [Paenibacillus sp. GCM10027626]|uniref:M81 family metallopeptidase n=1 Tax=Paenibacillus sp. GCM10027626 TaxID=3273411 RepID=UPI0036420A63